MEFQILITKKIIMKKHNILYIVFVSALFTSCRKIINVDLKNAPSNIVIEGRIDNNNPGKVTISKSVPFSSSNSFPPVTRATVKVTDDRNNNFILTESTGGTYSNNSLVGVPGRTYTLNITAEGKNYTATSVMPQKVNLDTLVQDKIILTNSQIVVNALFTDPAGFGNYYHFIETINGKQSKFIYVLDDIYQDAGIIEVQFFDDDMKLKAGDVVQIEMQCIDKNIYRYLKGLADLQDGGTVPANPESNINNGALGYFSGYTSQKKTIVIR
jgi:Domain of unknown function (DUF4249)